MKNTIFKPEAPFDASLFVLFRKRLGMDSLNEINVWIVAHKSKMDLAKPGSAKGKGEGHYEYGIGHIDDSKTAIKGGLEETWNYANCQATWKSPGSAGSSKTGKA